MTGLDLTFAGLAVGSSLAFRLSALRSFLLRSLISPLFRLRSSSSASRLCGSASGSTPLSFLNVSSLVCSLALRSEIVVAGGKGCTDMAGGRDDWFALYVLCGRDGPAWDSSKSAAVLWFAGSSCDHRIQQDAPMWYDLLTFSCFARRLCSFSSSPVFLFLFFMNLLSS